MAAVGEKVYFYSNQERSILDGLNKQRLNGTLCDVILRVSGQSIRAHSNVMSAASDYFYSVLGVKDDNSPDIIHEDSPQVITPQVIEINIDTIDDAERVIYFEVMQKLVDFIYSGNVKLSDRDISQTLQLAKLLKIDKAVWFCEEFVNSHNVAVSDQSVEYITPNNEPYINQENNYEHATDHTEYRGSQLFKCRSCNFIGKTKRQLRTHHHGVHIAQQIKENVCLFCHSQFLSRDECDEHNKLHYKPLPYFCTVCDKRFKTNCELKSHAVRHSTLRPYTCTMCVKSFKRKNSYELHIEAHLKNISVRPSHRHKWRGKYQLQDNPEDGANPNARINFLCIVCSKIFHSNAVFKQHLRTHSSDGAYKCHKCQYETTQRTALSFHLFSKHQIGIVQKHNSLKLPPTKHNGFAAQRCLKPQKESYLCLVCEKLFTTKCSLTRHMTVHSESRPFQCSQCDYSTKRRDTLKDHYSYVHHERLTKLSKKFPKREKHSGKVDVTSPP